MAHGHQRIFTAGPVAWQRASHINPGAVCTADLAAENSKQAALPNGLILLKDRAQRLSFHVTWKRIPKVLQQRGGKINRLNHAFGTYPLFAGSRLPNK